MFHEIRPEHDLVSIGALACQIQIGVRELERTAAELQIVPAWRLNQIPHFDGTQAAQLIEALADRVANRSK